MESCRHCKGSIHSSAQACPHCGGAYPTGILRQIMGALVVLLGFCLLVWLATIGLS
jgi:RNA polymerase subunit RPABC4/transcription elongation factor Spt4